MDINKGDLESCNSKSNVAIIDDHQLVLEALKMMLNSLTNIVKSTSTFLCYKDLKVYLELNEVDILITDLHMPDKSGIEILTELKKDKPSLKIILLTMAEEPSLIREAITSGVDAYLLKKTSREELTEAIRRVSEGKRYFSSDVIAELAVGNTDHEQVRQYKTNMKLTSRELEILNLIAKEFSTQQIAEVLFISENTVESHRSNLMRKLGVKSAIGMVKYAIKHGLTES